MAQADAANVSKLNSYAVLEGSAVTVSKENLYAVVVPFAQGSVAASLGEISLSSSGEVAVTASAAITIGNVSASAIAQELIQASVSTAIEPVTAVIAGSVVDLAPPLTASLTQALGSVVLSTTVFVFDPIFGSADIYIEDVTSSGASDALVSASLGITLDNLQLLSEAGALVSGDVSQTLNGVGIDAAAITVRGGAVSLLIGA